MNLIDQVSKRFNEKFKIKNTPWERGYIDSAIKDFLKLIKQEKKKTLLDLGCGSGWIAIHFAKNGLSVWGIDSSKTAIERGLKDIKKLKLKNINLKTENALNFSYKKDFFDCVFDRGFLHHIPEKYWNVYKKGLSKVLKKDGLFYLSVFSDDSFKKGFSPKKTGRLWNKIKDASGYWTYDHFFNYNLIKKIFGNKFKIIEYKKDKKISPNGSLLLHFIMRKK